jgi:hypothetical protein
LKIKSVRIEYRWAHGRHGRLPALAKDLVNHQSVVIVTTGGEPSALGRQGRDEAKFPSSLLSTATRSLLGLSTASTIRAAMQRA